LLFKRVVGKHLDKQVLPTPEVSSAKLNIEELLQNPSIKLATNTQLLW